MTTGIQDEELLRLYSYRDALNSALRELALTRAVSVSLNGRSITRQTAVELRHELGQVSRDIRYRLAYLGGNRNPEIGAITYYPSPG